MPGLTSDLIPDYSRAVRAGLGLARAPGELGRLRRPSRFRAAANLRVEDNGVRLRHGDPPSVRRPRCIPAREEPRGDSAKTAEIDQLYAAHWGLLLAEHGRAAVWRDDRSSTLNFVRQLDAGAAPSIRPVHLERLPV